MAQPTRTTDSVPLYEYYLPQGFGRMMCRALFSCTSAQACALLQRTRPRAHLAVRIQRAMSKRHCRSWPPHAHTAAFHAVQSAEHHHPASALSPSGIQWASACAWQTLLPHTSSMRRGFADFVFLAALEPMWLHTVFMFATLCCDCPLLIVRF